MINYKQGTAYAEEIQKEDIEELSTLFGEGSFYLTSLIRYCFENNIKTLASCKGHPENKSMLDALNEKGYITFQIDNDYRFATFLATIPLRVKKIKAEIEYPIDKKVITLRVPANKKEVSESYFNEILEEIKNYSNDIDLTLYKDINKLIEIVYKQPSNKLVIITGTKCKLRKVIGGEIKQGNMIK